MVEDDGPFCAIIGIMRLLRSHTVLKKLSAEDDSYVNAPPSDRVAFVWELTAELWSMKDKENAERRLQRDAANLVRPQG